MTQPSPTPALWCEPAPQHFDLRVKWWLKLLLFAIATLIAYFFVDAPLAAWMRAHPIPDLAYIMPTRSATAPATLPVAAPPDHPHWGDVDRELTFLEQYGQFSCSIIAVLVVAMLDPKGRRRALSVAIACLLTLAITHLSKDLVGRTRPFNHDLLRLQQSDYERLPDYLRGYFQVDGNNFHVPNSENGNWILGGPAMGFHKGTAWGSFPSAHTTAAFALASALAWFYPRGRGLFMTLAVIVGVQRILHYAHYVSDVTAGIAIGVLMARLSLENKFAGRLIALLPKSAQDWWLKDVP